jgi:hypothetical protein
VTKLRHKVFTDQHLHRMQEIMRAVCADFETELADFDGEDNHIHLLVNFPRGSPSPSWSAASRQYPAAGCGKSSSTYAATTTRPTSCGPGRTSPDPSPAHR